MLKALPELQALLSELRDSEPLARAFMIFGSQAREDAGPYSDLDLGVITTGPPVQRDRIRFLRTGDGQLRQVSIYSRPFTEFVEHTHSPYGWCVVAGIFAVVKVLEDPLGLVGVLRRLVEINRPPQLTSKDGTYIDLDMLLGYLAKLKNAYAAGNEIELFFAAQQVAQYFTALLVPLNEVRPFMSEHESRTRMLALAVAPPDYAADVKICAGWTTSARSLEVVFAAAMRLAEGVVKLLAEHLDKLSLDDRFLEDIRNGTVLSFVQESPACRARPPAP